ncbi:MAG TPA: response regulator transcription factor [Gemmatimonadales bacterium]
MIRRHTGQQLRVLLADDSDTIRDRLGAALGELACVAQVLYARDVDEAVRVIGTERPDLVVLDLRMPGGGGLEVMTRVRDTGWRPVIIVLTNYPYAAYRKRCLELGASHFFDKACEFQKVMDVTRALAVVTAHAM